MNTIRCPKCSEQFPWPAGPTGICPKCGTSIRSQAAAPPAAIAAEKPLPSRRAWLVPSLLAVAVLLGAGIGLYWQQFKQLALLAPQGGPTIHDGARGQPGPEPADPGVATGRKYALAVGINDYEHGKLSDLQYAVNDAAKLGQVLTRAGFAVTVLTDDTGKADPSKQPTKANIERALEEMLNQCRQHDLVVVALAGHGLQFKKKAPNDPDDSYFCPRDARPFPEQRSTLVSLARIYQRLDHSFAGMKVLLVDACRDDPDPERGTRGVDADLAARPPQGVAALFSCRAGERAYENPKLEHGVFFYHVIQGLEGKAQDRRNAVTFAGLAAYVNLEVPEWIGKNIPGAKQSPNLKADYSTEPVLVRRRVASVPPATTQPLPEIRPELRLLAIAEVTLEPGQGKSITVRVERKQCKGPIELRLEGLPAGVQPGPAVISADSDMGQLTLTATADASEGKHSVRLLALAADARAEGTLPLTVKAAGTLGSLVLGGEPMEFVRVPRGRFQMGSPDSDKDADSDEKPRHQVTFTYDLSVAKYHVTRGQFAAFVQATGYQTEAETDGLGGWGYNAGRNTFEQGNQYSWKYPGFTQTDRHPVVNVTWNDAQAFCRWAERQAGRPIQLLSEAEYEYANRAGATTRYFTGDDVESLRGYANIGDRASKARFSDWIVDDGYVFTAPVGSFKPNGFGLHDMTGNAWSWCADSYDATTYQRGNVTDPGAHTGSAQKFRVLRGASWNDNPGLCRAANRNWLVPGYRNYDVGFRVCFRLD